jgi:ubiquinol-cytochrome c reductase iron-sulfur subunit
MTDNNDVNGPADVPEGVGEEQRVPRRVIGTPPPGEQAQLVATSADVKEESGYVLDEAKARRAERVVATFFGLTFVSGIAFMFFYGWWPGTVGNVNRAERSNYLLGAAMTLAFLGLAIGMTIWVRQLMTSKEIIVDRGHLATDPEDRSVFNEYLMQGAEESGLTKRPLLRRSLLLASAPLGLAPLFLLRDLGPLPRTQLRHTAWKAGTRLVVDGTNQPIKATDFDTPGGIITVIPDGVVKLNPDGSDQLSPSGTDDSLEIIAKAAVVLINIPQTVLKILPGRENWHVGGIIAYSKICTHVGCPAALYERTTHHILCPCHQSTFDAANGAKVIFGPAGHPLPQLPIGVDAEGYLIATSDFHEPVGPSFWERGAST